MIHNLSLTAAAGLTLALQTAAAQAPQSSTTTTLPTVVVTAAREEESLTVPNVTEARAELDAQPGGTAIVDAELYKPNADARPLPPPHPKNHRPPLIAHKSAALNAPHTDTLFLHRVSESAEKLLNA